MNRAILLLLLALWLSGCTNYFTLPDPPPQSEWVEVEQPKEDEETVTKRMIEAKRAAIQCYAALASKNWSKALDYLSKNTRTALETASAGAGVAATFDAGELTIDGQKQSFDPVGDVFITGLVDIRDEFGGRKDVENANRHVFYAINQAGQARELVFVLEDNHWKLDRPDIFSPLITP